MNTDVELDLEELFKEPDHKPSECHDDNWRMRLNPTQQKGVDSTAKYVLLHGEKGSSKTIGGLAALVQHCYDEQDALALIIAPQIRTGKEGVLNDLTWVLDIFKYGNWVDKSMEERADNGMGLDYTDAVLDPQTKDRCVFIGNRHGGWSKVILISIPYASVVEKRMKALSPSFVFADEITELDGMEYFTYVAQQLGRRRRIKGPQQYYAACNPAGPSHWVYKVFFVDCVDAETGARDADYDILHVPIEENRHNLPDGYIEKLMKLYRDPTDQMRLLKGIWIDRPSGDAILKNYFIKELHVRGDRLKGMGIAPRKEWPIMVSMDPGPVNFCITIEQLIPTQLMNMWNVVDELNFVGMYKPYKVVVPELLKRIDRWQAFLGSQARFVFIAPEDAFSTMRPDGSYDSMKIQQLSGDRIRLRSCPRAKDSVPQRVQMVINMLMEESLHISDTCEKTIQSMNLLTSEKEKDGKYDAYVGLRPRRSPYLHPFDSMTYGMFYRDMLPGMFSSNTQNVGSVYFAK